MIHWEETRCRRKDTLGKQERKNSKGTPNTRYRIKEKVNSVRKAGNDPGIEEFRGTEVQTTDPLGVSVSDTQLGRMISSRTVSVQRERKLPFTTTRAVLPINKVQRDEK